MPGAMNLEPLTDAGDHAHAGSGAGGTIGGANPGDRAPKIKIGASIAALILAAVIMGWQLFSGTTTAGDASRSRTLVDAESGEVFENFPIKDGDRQPWMNPKTGKATLFPAERCFWTRDGKAKMKPTWVLLNQYAGKPGETICPDCGRRVVPHNPAPPDELFNELLAPAADPSAKPPG